MGFSAADLTIASSTLLNLILALGLIMVLPMQEITLSVILRCSISSVFGTGALLLLSIALT